MNNKLAFISSIGLGAGLMYLLDPDKGRRRRAIARDKLVSTARKAGEAAGTTSRDLANRTAGLLSDARGRIAGSGEVDDDVLVARVASKLGRVVSHPHAIGVTAEDGRVMLVGPIVASEVEPLLAIVESVPGVTSVDNQLEPHEKAGDIPALQGGIHREGQQIDILQAHWSPATRLLASVGGGLLAYYGATRRGVLGTTLGALGVGLAARGATNTDLGRLTGVSGGRRAVDVHKTITINAPLAQVFDFWANFENFPRFMTNVREVRKTGEGRSHWVVSGPGGVTVEWDAETTKLVPNEEIAWKSVEGSTIANAGVVKFRRGRNGETEVDIKLSYNPPAGAVGHVVASIVGADPKTQMDEDMLRLKTLLETGIAPHDAADKSPAPLQPYTH